MRNGQRSGPSSLPIQWKGEQRPDDAFYSSNSLSLYLSSEWDDLHWLREYIYSLHLPFPPPLTALDRFLTSSQKLSGFSLKCLWRLHYGAFCVVDDTWIIRGTGHYLAYCTTVALCLIPRGCQSPTSTLRCKIFFLLRIWRLTTRKENANVNASEDISVFLQGTGFIGWWKENGVLCFCPLSKTGPCTSSFSHDVTPSACLWNGKELWSRSNILLWMWNTSSSPVHSLNLSPFLLPPVPRPAPSSDDTSDGGRSHDAPADCHVQPARPEIHQPIWTHAGDTGNTHTHTYIFAYATYWRNEYVYLNVCRDC